MNNKFMSFTKTKMTYNLKQTLQEKRAFIPGPLVPVALLVGTNMLNRPPSMSPHPFSIGWGHQPILNSAHQDPPASGGNG